MATGLAQRNSRLGVPHLNRNQPHLKAGLANRIAAPKPPRPVGAAQPLHTPQAQTPTVPQTQSTPTDPLKAAAAPSAPPAPAPAATDPFAISPSSGPDDPRDATYWQNVTKLQFNDRNEYAKDLADQTTADSSYSAALQQAIQARATQERSLGESAIRGNLGSSGWLNRTQGEQVRDYTQERANASLSKSQEDAARLAARTALVQGFSLEEAQERAEAASRRAGSAVGEAETAEPLIESAGEAASGGGAARKASAPKASIGKAHAVSQPARSPSVGQGHPAAPQLKAALAKARKAKR
jgi:hypothetical protein